MGRPGARLREYGAMDQTHGTRDASADPAPAAPAPTKATVIRFEGWRPAARADDANGSRPPGTEGHGLVSYRIGSQHLNSGLLRFEPGAGVRLHFHNVEEQVTVVEGEAVAIVDGERHVLHPFDTTYVPAGVPHHFMNESAAPMTIHCTYGGTSIEQTFPETGEVRRHGKPPEEQP
jgi:putative monooxygenase